MFDSPGKLVLGLVTGIVFGFLLQKGRVAKHSVIVGQLLLRDWTVVKIMLTAVAVGAVGVWALVGAGMTTFEPKPFQLGGILIGAALFGIGLAILGYCPGTTVAAVGEGRRDALFGLLGMASGALLFVAAHPVSAAAQRALADLGKQSLPSVTATSPWIWVGLLALAALAVYAWARRDRFALRRQRAL